MLILLTRPWNQALRSAERLAAIGHTAILSPVLEIRRTGAAWPQGVFDAALATSARAFECLDLAPEWPPPELRRMLPLFVVGATTGEAARAAGFEGPLRVTLDVEALASVMKDRFEPGARLVYLAGRERKSDLELACTKAGMELEVVETYAAEEAAQLSEEAIDLFAQGRLPVVLHYSRRSSEIFLKLMAEAGLDPAPLIHVAISDDAAAPLLPLPKVIVAAKPTEDTILALLQSAGRAET
ncbi:MAG TPA: uroporphyrinogen-III synthase [Methylovirgula sp.]|nr:uroporphyrinogen-III synthase [Methylovirgula sp.]